MAKNYETNTNYAINVTAQSFALYAQISAFYNAFYVAFGMLIA